MGLFDFLNPVLDTILGPVISLPPFWAILILSVLISFLITWIYKKMTDQDLMKQLKDEMNKMRQQIKELKEDPKAAMSVQKKMMETNMKYMMQSMKATLVTFIPIILIFTWLSAHMAYEPLQPNQDFSVEAQFVEDMEGLVTLHVREGLEIISGAEQNIVGGKARWELKGREGEYILEFQKGDTTITKKVKITQERDYEPPYESVSKHPFKAVQVEQKQIIVMNLFGWELGWFGAYIIFSILSSLFFRKAMNVY